MRLTSVLAILLLAPAGLTPVRAQSQTPSPSTSPVQTETVQTRPAPASPRRPAKAAGSLTQQPSIWFESGLAYRRGESGLEPHLRVGFRGVQPLSDTVALYGAFAVDGDLILDLGGWYSFLPDGDDLFGFRSYAGTGLSYVAGSFGLALSAAVTYDLSPQTALLLVYTHRPLFLPQRGQAFDISVGARITVPE